MQTEPITALVAVAKDQTFARIEALLQAAPRSRYLVVRADGDPVAQLCSNGADVCLLDASRDNAGSVRLIRDAIDRGCFAPIVGPVRR